MQTLLGKSELRMRLGHRFLFWILFSTLAIVISCGIVAPSPNGNPGPAIAPPMTDLGDDLPTLDPTSEDDIPPLIYEAVSGLPDALPGAIVDEIASVSFDIPTNLLTYSYEGVPMFGSVSAARAQVANQSGNRDSNTEGEILACIRAMIAAAVSIESVGPIPKDGPTAPAQPNGYAYVFGGTHKTSLWERRLGCTTCCESGNICDQLLCGTDCSGFVSYCANAAELFAFGDVKVAFLSDIENWNTPLKDAKKGFRAIRKSPAPAVAELKAGDILLWPNHCAIAAEWRSVEGEATDIILLNSIGQACGSPASAVCRKNLGLETDPDIAPGGTEYGPSAWRFKDTPQAQPPLVPLPGHNAPTSIIRFSPLQVEIIEGDGQSTTIDTAFPTLLVVRVTEAEFGTPIKDVEVQFALPETATNKPWDPSGVFDGATTVLTNSEGIATAPALHANHFPGDFMVTANVDGLSTALQLHLTNECPDSIPPAGWWQTRGHCLSTPIGHFSVYFDDTGLLTSVVLHVDNTISPPDDYVDGVQFTGSIVGSNMQIQASGIKHSLSYSRNGQLIHCCDYVSYSFTGIISDIKHSYSNICQGIVSGDMTYHFHCVTQCGDSCFCNPVDYFCPQSRLTRDNP